MAKAEEVRAVIEANRSRQRRARELNVRAGEQVFPVLDQPALESWLRERLKGAVSVMSIPDPATLRLPDLDIEAVRAVYRENPDQIETAGLHFPISYVDGSHPSVTMSADAVSAMLWKKLPDQGIFLPGGRSVSVRLNIGWSAICDTNVPLLKAKARDSLNEGQWSNWPETDRPAIILPDPADENSVVGDVVTACYGKCVVTGADLVAFGTVALNPYRSYDRDPWFKVLWTRNRTEAEQAHDAVVAKIVAIKKEVKERREVEERRAREQRELDALKTQAEWTRTRLRGFYDALYNNRDIDRELRGRLYHRRYDYVPSASVDLRTWIAETEALCTEAKVATAEIEARNARREAHVEATRNFYSSASLLVGEDGTVSVLRGKTSKLGSLEVDNSFGERFTSEISTDNDGRFCSWQPVRTGRLVHCRDYSSHGNLNGEAKFVVQDGQLTPGVWGVAEDEEGRFFFPAIHYKGGREVVPEKFVVVREVKERPRVQGPVEKGPPAPVGSLNLDKLFGGALKPREKLPARSRR